MMKARLLGDDYHWPNTECVREYAHILVIRAVPVGRGYSSLFQHALLCYCLLAIANVHMLFVVLYWDTIIIRHFAIEVWLLSMCK